MTFRENTLTQLDTDIVKLTTANGYNFNYNYSKGLLDIIDIKLFPHVCYLLGGETTRAVNESETLHSSICDVVLVFYYAVNSTELVNNAIDAAEKVISDAKAFLHGWYTNKFAYASIVDRASEQNAIRLNIETIEPYPVQDNRGAILVIAKLEYLESD